ncbi:uncharacterized protein QO010_002522 [Caulobacter ginsengisoli]|uniref:DUF418 domain-containing protein n=1 Tax=Caulobacter ginsengisoli TaxID=400775 RepID=A0ABU0IRV0_9CAUL|nr:DUF418 domain-containing protein [Caulobacter ginsengisoli]MDQ0464738.1 uncharacterized protein [Caulobacter ginsengisoli]
MNQPERIAQIDVIRGVAVLGILTVNILLTAFPFSLAGNPVAAGPVDPLSQAWWLITTILFEGKFVTIFSALFGASLLLVGGEGQDRARNAIARRRLAWLLVFGLIHGAIVWYGDILLWYAICGAVAYLVRGWRPRWLLVGGLLLCLLTMTLDTMTALEPAEPGERFVTAKALAHSLAAFHGGLAHTQAMNFKFWLGIGAQMGLFYSWITLGLMMIGMALLKTGALAGRLSTAFYGTSLAVGALALTAIAIPSLMLAAGGFRSDALDTAAWVINTFAAPLVALGYLSAVVLVLKAGWVPRAMRALGQVGRMAFSNYIAQSLIMTGLLWGGRGLGLFGQLSLAQVALVVLAVWTAQLIWSPLWLARFHYGPLEWVWRRLSYAQPTPFLRKL